MSPAATASGSTLAFDVTVALAAALAWGVCDVVLGGTGAGASGLLGAIGRAASVAVPLVVVLRAARPWPRSIRALCLGALLGSVPLAVVGTLLVEKTHHRALGGVTFAALALGVILLGWLLALRLLPAGADPAGTSKSERIGPVGLVAVGTAALFVLVAVLFAGPPAARGAAVGLVAVVLATGAPTGTAPRILGITSVLLAVGLALGAAAAGPDASP